MKGSCEEVQKNEDQEGGAAATGPQAKTLEAKKPWNADSRSALETEGTSSTAWGPGRTPLPVKVVGGRLERNRALVWVAFPQYQRMIPLKPFPPGGMRRPNI